MNKRPWFLTSSMPLSPRHSIQLKLSMWFVLVALLVVALGWWREYRESAAADRARRAIEEAAYQEAHRQFGKPGDAMTARASKHGNEWWVSVETVSPVAPDSGCTMVFSEDGKFIRISPFPYAIYKDFRVLGGVGGELTAGFWGPIPPTIFIQVADGSAFALKDLPEFVAAKYSERWDTRDTRPGDAAYRKGHAFLEFTHGKLTYACLNHSWDGLEFSSNLEGPFHKFPLTREQIVELFGEPLEWRRAPKQLRGP